MAVLLCDVDQYLVDARLFGLELARYLVHKVGGDECVKAVSVGVEADAFLPQRGRYILLSSAQYEVLLVELVFCAREPDLSVVEDGDVVGDTFNVGGDMC